MRPIRMILSLLVHLALLLIAVDALYALYYYGAMLPMEGAQPSIAAALYKSMPAFMQPATLHRREAWWIVAAALVVLSWAAGLMALRVRPKALRVKTPDGGALLLDPGAIINFTKSQVDAHPAVTHHRVNVKQVGGKSVAITARVRVIPTQSLPEIKRELETAIRTGFSQVLGIEKIDDITIILNLDEKHLGTRPGPAGRSEAAIAAPTRAALEPAPDGDETREFSYDPPAMPDETRQG